MLEVINLTCVRDERVLFSELNFSVCAGDIVQIEGANGTGKTSLLRLLTGLSRPESGQVYWQQKPLHQQREAWHCQLFYLGHQTGVKAVMTPLENLAFWHKKHDELHYLAALEAVDLAGYEDMPVAQLSAGQQRRVALAGLWLSEAPLWILDEPLTAIDHAGQEKLIALFNRHAARGGMIVLTTHQALPATQRTIRKICLDKE